MKKFFWMLFWFGLFYCTVWVEVTRWNRLCPDAAVFLTFLALFELICFLFVTFGTSVQAKRDAVARQQRYAKIHGQKVVGAGGQGENP